MPQASFYHWRRKLREESGFAEVRVAPDRPASAAKSSMGVSAQQITRIGNCRKFLALGGHDGFFFVDGEFAEGVYMHQTVGNIEASIAESSRRFPKPMGIVLAMKNATDRGYDPLDTSWTNMGQGQPEVGPINGAPARHSLLGMESHYTDDSYGPLQGAYDLRRAVADHYNRLYRKKKRIKYTPENVAITAGGRLALARIIGAMAQRRVGFVNPDYAAFGGILSLFGKITPVPITSTYDTGFKIVMRDFLNQLSGRSVEALLLSNPCNPTGTVVGKSDLSALVSFASESDTMVILDEYYSPYVYNGNGALSAASIVEDVEDTPLVIVDGLTKSFRLPGWRIGWIVGPRTVIQNIVAVGSQLDGGAPSFMQRAATAVLAPEYADRDLAATRACFGNKRDFCLNVLQEDVGVEFPYKNDGTIYLFGAVGHLPPPLNTGLGFFESALKHQVITVPGEYFDLNEVLGVSSGQSALKSFVRFSFGPSWSALNQGIDRLREMVASI